MTRENWRAAWGPLELRMPVDPVPQPGVDWQAAYDNGETRPHFDWLDSLRNKKWYTDNPAEAGGSMVQYGYSAEDPDAEIIAIKAIANSIKPDNEHGIREMIYPFDMWEKTHAPVHARQINSIVTRRIAGWLWNGVPQLDHWASVVAAAPHVGINVNGREFGWLLFGKAMVHKVTRTSRVWSLQALDVCERAAMPGTGQVIVDTHTGIDQTGIFYCFHHTKLAMGALALAYRVGRPAPKWVLDYALSLNEQPGIMMAGWPSPPSFLYSKGIRMKACTGAEQHPDPAWGDWSSLCVALAKVTGDHEWINRAYRFGCGVSANSGDERRSSLLLRGWVS